MRAGRRIVTLIPTCGALLASALLTAGTIDEPIPFPADYRTWAHVKSVLVGPESPAFATEAGIHHIYANAQAVQGYRAGRFPDGSIVVYDLLETKEVGGNTIEGAQRRIDVMVKDSRRFKDSDGWRFARFWGADRVHGELDEEKQRACLGCHSKRKDRDFVFSEFRR